MSKIFIGYRCIQDALTHLKLDWTRQCGQNVRNSFIFVYADFVSHSIKVKVSIDRKIGTSTPFGFG